MATSATTGGTTLQHSLVENSTLDNLGQGVAFRHPGVRNNVARNIVATMTTGTRGNLVIFRDGASYNVVEDSFADGVYAGVYFRENPGETGFNSGGSNNRIVNTIFASNTHVILEAPINGDDILPSTDNAFVKRLKTPNKSPPFDVAMIRK